MRKLRIFQIVLSNRCKPSLADMAKKQSRMGKHLYFFFICIILTSILLSGCSHSNGGSQAKSTFEEANVCSSLGSYQVSLNKYQQILEKYPTTADRALFEMGIIYSHPKNEQKNYQKSLECFQKLIKDYPGSGYRQDSEMMIFSINNVAIKDKTISTQQTQIKTLQQEVKSKENEISTLQKKIEALEQKVFAFAIQKGSADRILIEKKATTIEVDLKG